MRPAFAHLQTIATTVAQAHRHLPTIRAAMVTGSIAKDLADEYSDVDLTFYYEGELPAEDVLAGIRNSIGGSERRWLIGDRADGGFAEAFGLDGIEVQIGHTTITAWEEEIAEVRERFNCDTPLHKAMEGTLACRPLFGDEWIRGWQAQIADYPDALATAMVEKHLAFFPIWGLEPHFRTRDATLWLHQSLVESAFNLLGVLAGLNRQYFTTFQFKRTGRFIDGLAIKPERFAARLENLFIGSVADRGRELESLVTEVVALVREHRPAINTTKAAQRLGWRVQPWTPK